MILAEFGRRPVKNHRQHTTQYEKKMYTLLAQLKACMNSRPLTPISNNLKDFAVLTPSHFLTGQNLFELPDDNIEKIALAKMESRISDTTEAEKQTV